MTDDEAFYKQMIERNFASGERMTGAEASHRSGIETFDLQWYRSRNLQGDFFIQYADGAYPVRVSHERGYDDLTKLVLYELGRVKHAWTIAEDLAPEKPGGFTGTMHSAFIEFENGKTTFYDSRLYGISGCNLPEKAYETGPITEEMTLF